MFNVVNENFASGVRKVAGVPFDQFEGEWDAKLNWLERQIEALKDQENLWRDGVKNWSGLR